MDTHIEDLCRTAQYKRHDLRCIRQYLILDNAITSKCQPRSQSHLFAIRGRRKRGPGALQTRDQNLPK